MRLQSVGLFFLGVAFKWTVEILTSLSTTATSLDSSTAGSSPPLDHQPSVIVAHAVEQGGNSLSSNEDALNKNDIGWRDIHIFRGPQQNENLQKIGKAVGYSQSKQDTIILELLNQKKGGYFVDLAANHAVVLSNTFRLETNHGWRGLCIEPNPAYEWGHLHRSCSYVRAIIGANRMEKVKVVLPTDQSGPGGGIVNDKFDNNEQAMAQKAATGKTKASQMKPVEMYTVSLTEILDRFKAPQVIDYLSLDVEGAEYYVMQSFAFDRYKIRVMTVERPNQELVDLFYKEGYVYLAAFNEFGDETLFVLKSEIAALNLTVAETTLYKSSTTLMDVPKDTFTEKPGVLVARRSKLEMKSKRNS